MNMIRLAVSFDEPGIFEVRNGTHVGVQTMAPLRINKTFSPLGTPDHVQIYTEKLACHALSNWIAGEAVKKILAPSAAPSALIAEAPNSRPHGRAYSLAALRASAPIWETPGTASSGLCAHMGNSRYCLFGPLRPYGKLQVLPLRASAPISGNSRYCLSKSPGKCRNSSARPQWDAPLTRSVLLASFRFGVLAENRFEFGRKPVVGGVRGQEPNFIGARRTES